MTNKNSPIFKAICSMPIPIEAERDYIECKILDALFADTSLSDKLVFSGGATLSKSYNIRHRISDDIDLVCTDFNEVPQGRSRRQLNNFKGRFKEFVFDQLRTSINYAINQDLHFMITTDREWRALHNPGQGMSYPVLHVLYKSMLNNSVGHICIEIIPRKYDISAISYQAAVPYALNTPTREIPTVSYAQTFWDKVFALHCTACSHTKGNNHFISRHYADVAQIADKVNIDDTFHLFQDTVAYQTKYTTKEIAPIPSTTDIRLMPDDATLSFLAADFYKNKDQFTALRPNWDNVVNKLQALKVRLDTSTRGR